MEKERDASEKMMDVTSRISALELQVSTLRQDKSRLQAQLDMERTKAELLEEAKHKYEFETSCLLKFELS